jgi:hypothetical protein
MQISTLLKLLLMAFMCFAAVVQAQTARVSYERPNDPRMFETYTAWQDGKVLESMRGTILRRFNVENLLSLSLKNCGQSNAFYRSDVKEIVMCWELLGSVIDSSARRFGSNRDLMINAATSTFVFILYHELGHALVDLKKTATFGREEDNADQIATLLLLEDNLRRNHAESTVTMLGVFDFWQANNNQYLSRHELTGQHSPGQQRAFNVICWALGSDPISRYKHLAQMTKFPLQKIDSCVKEYQRATTALNDLIIQSGGRR